jgi:hypothetical protein
MAKIRIKLYPEYGRQAAPQHGYGMPLFPPIVGMKGIELLR